MKNLTIELETIQISAASGPKECEYVVKNVFEKLLQEAEDLGIKTKIQNEEIIQGLPFFESIILELQSPNLQAFLKKWVGTIQWISNSNIRPNHKRKNWFVGISILKNTKIIEPKDSDFQYQTLRSSGAGGQHINKVSSAVRITYTPSGLSLVAMDSRSQHQNKKIALQRMMQKLNEASFEEMQVSSINNWKLQKSLVRGNPVRIFEEQIKN
jgi:peptide chain release factor